MKYSAVWNQAFNDSKLILNVFNYQEKLEEEIDQALAEVYDKEILAEAKEHWMQLFFLKDYNLCRKQSWST